MMSRNELGLLCNQLEFLEKGNSSKFSCDFVAICLKILEGLQENSFIQELEVQGR